MLSRVRDFLTRHQRKFIVSGVVIGGTFFALRYAQRRLIEFQEQKAREFFEKTRRLQHFESSERTCNQVIIGMGTELCNAVIHECSTDSLLEELRQNPTNKLELWEEMKIVAFTRLATLIYASSMLVVTLRVQLNVLVGYLYRDITTEKKQISDEFKERYLSIIRHFLQEGGLAELTRFIRAKVVNALKSSPLNKRYSLADLEQLFWSLQMAINSDASGDPNTKIGKYMLPSLLPPECDTYGELMQRMFNETLDLLESDDASSVCSYNVCRGFSLATDAIAESIGENLQLGNGFASRREKNALNESFTDASNKVKETETDTNTERERERETKRMLLHKNDYDDDDEPSTSAASALKQVNSLMNINGVEIALAKIIPIVSGLTSKGFDPKTRPQNLATSLITFYVIAEKSKTLGANVYESFATS